MGTSLDIMLAYNMAFLFPVQIACCPLLRVQYPASSLPAGIIHPEMLRKAYRCTGTLLKILLLLIPFMLKYVQL